MISAEILKKVRQIQIRTDKMVTELFAGEYQSAFKGRGMEFEEVREYIPGDEIRSIDWNVTARTGSPHVKRFVEERELTVMLLVDMSSSAFFGTTHDQKIEIATELCAVLAFSAIKSNDKVGLIMFTDKIEVYIPPKKGKKHVLQVIRHLLYYKPEKQKTDISMALEFLSRVNKRKTVCFLVSDFITRDYQKDLLLTSKRHDLIAMQVIDPVEIALPNVGLIELEDAETGEQILVDTGSFGIRKSYEKQTDKELNDKYDEFRSMGVDSIVINTGEAYIQKLISFFRMRERRR